MTDDLVRDLRATRESGDPWAAWHLAIQAADRIEQLEAALEEGRRAIGDHFAPSDCYATGPLTGDRIRDLVECPACSFILIYNVIKGTSYER